LPLKADSSRTSLEVRFVPQADIAQRRSPTLPPGFSNGLHAFTGNVRVL
jgi:hypothetical protein